MWANALASWSWKGGSIDVEIAIDILINALLESYLIDAIAKRIADKSVSGTWKGFPSIDSLKARSLDQLR
jgi:hypothetical protein